MALFLGQSLCRVNWGSTTAALARRSSPILFNGSNVIQRSSSSNLADRVGESFWDKNKRLNRPISPHLTIYKWEITMSMSLAHRTTGIVLSTGLYGFGIGSLFLSANFPHYISALQSMHFGSGAIYLAKFILAYPLFFHLCSGSRHLLWDLGKGFDIKSVNTSGFAAIAAALALTAVVAAL
ncbi:hypothetical protein CHUAL_012511 [Chamberlinius hualienensis]